MELEDFDLKVCDEGMLIQLLYFWILSNVLLFIWNTQRLGCWILSPKKGEKYSVGPNRYS
jgi:hypothetical protein